MQPDFQRALSEIRVTDELAGCFADVVYALELHPEFRFTYVSPSVEALVGYAPAEHYADPQLGTRLLDPRDLDVLGRAMATPVGQPIFFAVRWVARDGRIVWTEHHCRKVLSPGGRITVFGAVRDVTAHRRADADLIDERERYRLLSENVQDVVYGTDLDRRVAWVSPSVTPALGWLPEQMVGRHIADLVHPDDLSGVREKQLEIIASGGSTGEVEVRIATATGAWRWMRVVGRVVRDSDGVPTGGIDELRDIQSEVETRALLQREMDHDALTGLARREVAVARIRDVLASRKGREWALLCAGVDRLTAVNQAYTHAAGDRVLTTVSERLVAATGSVDRVARVAGDEFVILLPDVVTAGDAGDAAERLLTAVRGSVAIGPHEIDVSICVGIAMADGQDAEELLRDATTALRQAGTHGGDRWGVLDENVAAQARRRLTVQAGLRDALATGQIQAWFQPIASLRTGTVVGHEALARWIRPDGTMVQPDDFLDVAEPSGLVSDVDRTILRQALGAMSPSSTTHMAVNVSAATLSDPTFAPFVQQALARASVRPERLHLEVTETALLHVTDEVVSGMQALAHLGVSWWVDDFGTGFSSISHLRDLPVQGLKLDRSFTAGLEEGDQRSLRLAQGLVGLARGLALETVAEGVETEVQADILLGQGWSMGQGWYFGRPAPLDHVG